MYFSLCKDGKKGDHIGRSFSCHFWELSATTVFNAISWELRENTFFEAIDGPDFAVFYQRKGLPIGGHLSAGLVELVALYREFSSWPEDLINCVTSRYRDNFFVAFPFFPSLPDCQRLAPVLTNLLGMPVKFVSVGTEVRCLELRLGVAPDRPPRVTVAFRTDEDRQGESKDVTSWPPRSDPRARLVVSSLLHGLAAKLRLYRVAGTTGYPAAIRRALRFLRDRQYPKRWWVRQFAQALLRQGAPIGCLPRLLRAAVQ